MKYMMKCTLFTCAESALVSDFLSLLRFSFLCITHTMMTIKTAPSANLLKENIHPR